KGGEPPAAEGDSSKKKVPDKAWVVEIRGYTYVDKADQFIVDALLENLRFPEMVNPAILPQRFAEECKRRGRPVPAIDPKRQRDMLDHERRFQEQVLSQVSFMFLYRAE